MTTLEATVATLRRELEDLKQSVYRTGSASVGHSPTHGNEDHIGGLMTVAGIIAIWAGTVASIPTGWVLCDGTNGTPDLRDRFVKGAAAGAGGGATGGAATHTHAGHSSHAGHSNHVVTQPSAHSNHVVTQPSDHALSVGAPSGANVVAGSGTDLAKDTSHTHALSGTQSHSGADVDSHSAHSGSAVDAHSAHAAHSAHDSPNNEPAYYTVLFIQKT